MRQQGATKFEASRVNKIIDDGLRITLQLDDGAIVYFTRIIDANGRVIVYRKQPTDEGLLRYCAKKVDLAIKEDFHFYLGDNKQQAKINAIYVDRT